MKKLFIKKREREEILEVPEERLCKVKLKDCYNLVIDDERRYMAERGNGEFENNAIYLIDDYDWMLGKDSQGEACLVPLKKNE